MAKNGNIDEMYTVYAGKFRRYNGEGWKQILDIRSMYLNLRDGFRVITGIIQSLILLRRIKPGVVFTRGSYVSVPVTLAAAMLKIPYITHDSDAIPSLTNRIISKWASIHAVALPEELYPYPIDKTLTVGVPVGEEYKPVDDALLHTYRQELNIDNHKQVLLITGGGLGAERLNTAAIENAGELLRRFPGLVIIHLTGRLHEQAVRDAYAADLKPEVVSRVMVKGFVSDMYRYTGSADVVIARGGATNLAELAIQAKTCIVIPNPLLTGGHQLKNTAALTAKGAIIEMTEEQLSQELRLANCVAELLDNPERALILARNLARFATPEAAERLAEIILETHKKQPGS